MQILAKKGPLGIIWIAATLDKRLKRTQVFEANIDSSVGAALQQGPEVLQTPVLPAKSAALPCLRFDTQPSLSSILPGRVVMSRTLRRITRCHAPLLSPC